MADYSVEIPQGGWWIFVLIVKIVGFAFLGCALGIGLSFSFGDDTVSYDIMAVSKAFKLISIFLLGLGSYAFTRKYAESHGASIANFIFISLFIIFHQISREVFLIYWFSPETLRALVY